jgi:hypothetical protein
MIQAANSPSDAGKPDNAEPDTGIADASRRGLCDERAQRARDDERDRSRARELRRRSPRQHEDASADDAAMPA